MRRVVIKKPRMYIDIVRDKKAKAWRWVVRDRKRDPVIGGTSLYKRKGHCRSEVHHVGIAFIRVTRYKPKQGETYKYIARVWEDTGSGFYHWSIVEPGSDMSVCASLGCVSVQECLEQGRLIQRAFARTPVSSL